MHIAIAVDGSDNSLRAVHHALKLAQQLKEIPSLALINVHLSALISPVAKGIDREQIEKYMDQIAEEELQAAKKAVAAENMKAKIIKGRGEVAPTILEIIKEENADMLIVGGKGRSSLTDLLLGSITSKLISVSPIPVLVVK
jgi:nucleotide-binding universal stress UspA family protein